MRVSLRHALAGALALGMGAAYFAWSPDNASAATANQFVFATGAGPGGGPHVKVFTANGAHEEASFFAYGENFHGGVEVAVGDLDGDGKVEIITGAGPGGAPHVRAFTDHGADYPVSFYAYNQAFPGGVHVGVSDVDGDGDDEIITGPGAAVGSTPTVRVWDVNPQTKAITLIKDFNVLPPNFTGGVYVAGIFVDQFDKEGIVIGAGPGGGPQVRVFNSEAQPVNGNGFYAYDPLYNGGVSVGAYKDDKNDVQEIVTGALAGRGHVRGFTLNGSTTNVSFYAFDDLVNSGVMVGTIDGDNSGPFLVSPFHGGGSRPCAIDSTPPNCAQRFDYVFGKNKSGVTMLQQRPYGDSWNGGVNVAGGFGTFTDTIPTTTTSSSSTSSSSTSSTSSSSTSSSTTSTTAAGSSSET